ncbi:hypothetical protein PRIPAC_92087 [Pristionchus pacificus]|uniref:Uncharacterized protein n=1 Tax=Pristionchus pacificus TaxID=54126 RepID=A0A2A6CQL5_PRIPA|nr:hypothetical protein PRIPAC_92087 [Pristionchus pacificus]|eukprot:PDM80505.1 hypothetical protein PRIPAC_35497 [Pristionchus pacificus]
MLTVSVILPSLFLLLIPSISSLCNDAPSCIAKIRRIATEPRHFWFGEESNSQCHSSSSSSQCWTPPSLAPFHSLGQRLFRVRTFHDEYLRNLMIYPKMTFRSPTDTYRGCDHDWTISNISVIESNPEMEGIQPFITRFKPEISWHGLMFNDEFTLALIDVGFGTLNWLVEDFPRKTRTLREYSSSDNFRSSPNPLALLVFKKGSKPLEISSVRDNQFNLQSFMEKNELEDNLIGLSLLIVSTDPYAIERQRLKGGIDNCHSLLIPKLPRSSRVLSLLPLDEIDSWISVIYLQPQVTTRFCCRSIRLKEQSIVVDPIGITNISSISVISPPLVSSLISIPPTPSSSYRIPRTFVALEDSLFTLVLIDSQSGALHWMIIDIPQSILAIDVRMGGVERASYVIPVGEKIGSCSSFFFILLQQSTSLLSIPPFCRGICHDRNTFRLDIFSQRYNLRIRSISQSTHCNDLPYAYHLSASHPLYGSPSSTLAKREEKAKESCKIFQLDSTPSCHNLFSHSNINSILIPSLIILNHLIF